MAFEYNFVTEPDDSLKCLICLEVATNPSQHENCGKLFCSACIKKNGNRPCPNCKAVKPQYFKDTKSKIYIFLTLTVCGMKEFVIFFF